ncbi:MAG: hypothetical protein J0M15_07595 [Deltaproteobacteria bacterium]|nr:hypothetical protein [Deltaproteobacteria bacterium]
MSKIIFLLFLTFGFFQISKADGPGLTGGGDVVPTENGSAWFLGTNKRINTCIVRANNFSVHQDVIISDIRKAFSKWEQYYNLTIASVDYNRTESSTPTFNFTVSELCSGKEDLVFYFNVSTPETEKAKKSFFNPIAFSRRTDFNKKSGWSKGFVWFSNSISPYTSWLKKQNLLHAAILHELGHIYGNDHVKETIMTPDLQHFLLSASNSDIPEQLKFLESIDHNIQYINHKENFMGRLYPASCELLLGIKNCGSDFSITAPAILKEMTPFSYSLSFDIGGNSKNIDIQITKDTLQTFYNNTAKAFHVYLDEGFPNGVYIDRYSIAGEGSIQYGNLTLLDGSKLPLVISKNSTKFGAKKLLVQFFDKNGIPIELFSSYTVTQ